MEVKSVVADPPSNCTFLGRRRGLIRLTLDAEVHDVVAADGAVVDHDIPSPKRYSVPLLDFESFLAVCPCFACFRALDLAGG